MSVNWIKAQIIPKQWEGTRKLQWSRGEVVEIATVPVDFSRDDRHCDGYYFANVPEPPEKD